MIHFTATTICPDAPHTVMFYGQVTGETITLEGTWTTRRWYWTNQIVMEASGTATDFGAAIGTTGQAVAMRPPGPSLAGIVLRVANLIAVLVLATWGAHMVRDALNLRIRPDNELQVHRMIMPGSAACIGLLALPFVPGAEIGLAMLVAFGPAIAPLIYVCTVASMILASTAGRVLPIDVLRRVLSTLRMHRAADLVARAAPLSGDDRLAMLLDGQSARALRLAIRYRCIALAVAVNTRGNSVIGGGGGIMLMARLSGIFSPLATVATIAIAVSPVPLAMVFFGLRF